MLEFSQAQVDQLLRMEAADFVSRVHAALIAECPEFAAQPQLWRRLMVAHDAAVQLGIEDEMHRCQFLYQEARSPSFHSHPAVQRWLALAGASPDERWRDFMATLGPSSL